MLDFGRKKFNEYSRTLTVASDRRRGRGWECAARFKRRKNRRHELHGARFRHFRLWLELGDLLFQFVRALDHQNLTSFRDSSDLRGDVRAAIGSDSFE